MLSLSASTSGILIFKVDITWDETDHERVTSLSRTFNKEELLDMDFQAYLASSSEEEEEPQQGTYLNKCRAQSISCSFGHRSFKYVYSLSISIGKALNVISYRDNITLVVQKLWSGSI